MRASKKNKIKAYTTLIGLSVILLALTHCESKKEQEYENHAQEVQYVGMDACVTCHSDIHKTYIHTGMGKSFHTASKEKSAANFTKKHVVYDSFLQLYYQPFWRGESLYIKEFALSGRDTTHVLQKKIDYIVGSGHHTNSHLFSSNGYLYQAPLTFYVQKGIWDLPPGYENGNNSRFSRILNNECISCHNAMPKNPISEYKFESIGQGIDCERCHGPGELHVKERLQGKGPSTKNSIDPKIVNPKKLSWERQIDLCQRCHLQGLNVLKPGKSFTDFRPGMVLSDVFEIFLPKYDGSGYFDMANHADRLQQSKCFINSNKNELSLTCITCHNPHVSVKETNANHFNQTCENCHKEKKCTAPSEKLKQQNNDCVACHMPVRGAKDIPHVSVHDHLIAKPITTKQQEQIGKLVGLYSVNNSKTDEYTFIKAYLEYWEKFDKNPFFINKAGQMLQKSKYNDLKIKHAYLSLDYKKVIDIYQNAPETYDAWTIFNVAIAYQKLRQTEKSLQLLNTANKLAPLDIHIAKELMSASLQNNQLNGLEPIIDKYRKEFPDNGNILAMEGAYKLRINDLNSAKRILDQANRILPNDAQVAEYYLNYYLLREDANQTKNHALKVLRLKPNHPQKEILEKLSK